MATPDIYWQLYKTYYGHDSLRGFQRFADLPQSEVLDSATVEKLYAPRCGVSDALRSTLEARWRKRHLDYYVGSWLVGVPTTTQEDIFRAAWTSWEQVTNVRLTRVADAEEADLVISTGRGPRAGFDGPSGTLAWAQLPNGSDQPLLMRFDLDERWNQEVQLLNVAAHEFGHLLGLDHDTQNSGSLMAPFYSRQVSRPQENDIRRIQNYYGPPLAAPSPPVPFPVPIPTPTPPLPPSGEAMRDIVTLVVSFVIGIIKQYNPLIGRFLEANQNRIVDIVMRRFGLDIQLSQINLEQVIAKAIAEIGPPPTA